MKNPLIIIPSYISRKEHAELLHRCVRSLRDTTDADILIVDDGSPFQKQSSVLYDYFGLTYDDVEIEKNEENSGFSKTVNVGLEECKQSGRDAILVNADMEFPYEDWFENIGKSESDIVGGLLFYKNGLVQHAGIYFSRFTRVFDHRFRGAPPELEYLYEPCECPVTGALQYISNDVINVVGLYDEEFRLGFEDVDFMIRAIHAGYKSTYEPDVKAIHHESIFRGEHYGANEKHIAWQNESLLRLLQKYKGFDFSHIAPAEVK